MCDSKNFEKGIQIKKIDINGLVFNNLFLFKVDSKRKKNIAAIQRLLQNFFEEWRNDQIGIFWPAEWLVFNVLS